MSFFKKKSESTPSLRDFFDVQEITKEGCLIKDGRIGLMVALEGIDGSFLAPQSLERLHNDWRSSLRLFPGEELQITFRKRVEFAQWIEHQLEQSFLSDSHYGRQLLL